MGDFYIFERKVTIMADKEGRIRLLRTLQILQNETDEQHPISIVQIEKALQERWQIPAFRITVQSDIAALQQAGHDIAVIKSTQNRYYYRSRLFEPAELKLLIDAVESSKFITEQKSKDLVEKLVSLASVSEQADLKRNTTLPDRIKARNEKIYEITDALNAAINRNRKVSFRYFHYDENKKRKLKNDGKPYVLSPFTLTWNGDHYYVVGWSDKHAKIAVFRVDRIFDVPTILDEPAVKRPKGFSVGSFAEKAFRMFDTDQETVTLLCDNDMMSTVIDHFGTKIKPGYPDLGHFQIDVEVSVSPTFFSWIFEYGPRVQVLAPENVRKAYSKQLIEAKKGV